MPPYATTKDVARVLGISRQRVRQYAAEARIPFRLTPGGHRRYDMGAVHAALARLDRTKGPGRASLLVKIKEAIREVESDSRIILFGSRARGDASPESDWDLVVIVEGPVDLAREVALWDRLFDVMLDDPSFPVVQALMFDRADWERRLSGPGLGARVTREGIEL